MNYEWRLLTICLVIIGLPFLMSSCAQTLRELEDEALVTGDWSRVEKREKRYEYDNALDAASKSCNDMASRAMFLCVDLPNSREVRDIYRYCSCVSYTR
jgi:hypothetical protein